MDWWTQYKDAILAIVAVLGVIGAIMTAIWAAIKWGFLRRWQRGLRVDVNVFEVITNPAVLLPKLYTTENDNSPLADHLVTYQPRDPNRDIQAELKAALNHSRYLLITAPTGYGKTREAGMLAQTMMLEGWRVLRIKTGWLDVPKTLPEELNDNRSRVLIFLDDLNGLFSIGERTQSPRAERIPMLNEASYHDRLLQVLDMFEGMCTKSEVRVVATARSETEQWRLLNFDVNDKLWKRFQHIELPGPIDTTIINLLSNSTKQLDLRANPDDFATIAHKSDGTYRNILLNLRRWQIQSGEVSKDDFTETLDGSWQDIYENAIRKHPAVKYIYEAIDLLQQVGIWLEDFIVEPTALLIWGGSGLQRFVRSVQISLALEYLTKETKILRKTKGNSGEISPSDGQIEVKGNRTDWSKYISDLESLILDLQKRPVHYPGLLVAYLLFQLSRKCLVSGNNEDAIRIWQRIPPDKLKPWVEEFTKDTFIEAYPGAKVLLHHAFGQKDSLVFTYFLSGIMLEIFDHDTDAESVFRQIIAKDPYDACAHAKLGDILRKLERYGESEKAYCQAITNDPEYAYAYSRLGSLLRVLERYSEAEDAYRKAIAKDPEDIFTYWRFGALLLKLKRYVEAEEIYRQARAKGGNDIYISYINSDFGNMLRKLGRYAEAETAYRKAIELFPQDANAYKHLVYLLRFEVSNREADALPFLEKWMKVDQQDFHSYLAASSIRKKLGKTVSVDYIDKARQLMPEDDWYNRACLESICDNPDAVFDYLQSAKQNEKFNPTWAWKDPDLEWVRSDPRFAEIVGPKPEEKNPEA